MQFTFRLSRRSKYGKHHDLDEYLEDLQEEYFDHEDLRVDIKWGRFPRPGTAGLSWGLYYPDDRLIVINPILDYPDVPRYFVKQVVHHEMLHSKVPSECLYGKPNGPKTYHTETFRKLEAEYKYYAMALRWEENNVNKIFRRIGK